MILATLIFDPFAQQLISTHSCMRLLQPNNASTSRANFYQTFYAGLSTPPSLDMQRSINQGFLGTIGDFSILPSCPTGNCNFPKFNTLGVCTSCEDVSSSIVVTNTTKVENVMIATTGNEVAFPSSSAASNDKTLARVKCFNISYSLPAPSIHKELDWTIPEHRPLSLLMDPPSCIRYQCSDSAPTLLKVRSDGATFDVLSGFLSDTPVGYLPDSAESSHSGMLNNTTPSAVDDGYTHCDGEKDNSWLCQGKGAARCVVRPCVQTLSTAVVNRTLFERIAESIDIPLNNSLEGSTIARRECLVSNNNASLIRMGLPLGPRDTWLLFAALPYWYGTNAVSSSDGTDTFGLPRDIPHGFVSPSCAFNMDSLSYSSFTRYLSTVFTGDITMYSTKSVALGGPASTVKVNPEYAPLQVNPLLNEIWQGGNLGLGTINNTLQALAESVTAHIRRNGAPGYNEPASGTMYEYNLCVKVRWGWIAYPCVMASFVFAFLIAVVAESVSTRQERWQTSSLPVLLHGLESPPMDASGHLLQIDNMESMVKDTKVQFAPSRHGWKLVGRVSDDLGTPLVDIHP